MLNSQTSTMILLVVCAMLMIITIIVCVISIRFIKRLTSQINEQSRVLYNMDKRNRRFDTSLQTTNEAITSLSTSVVSLASGYQKQLDMKIYPKPELVEQITQTVTDLLTIEVGLSKNMRISRKESVQLIVQNTMKTYPDVDPEYITKKALSMIEAYTSKE